MTFDSKGWMPTRIISRTSAQDGDRLERRRFARVKLELPGRYLTPEGEEFECMTVDFSPSGVRFQSSARPLPNLGANVIAYVRDLGRLQGAVIRRLSDGFVMAVNATELKLQRLEQKIAWLKPESAPDRRLFPRVVLPEGASIPVRCADGRSENADIIDISEGGIAFRASLSLALGERLEIGEQSGVVVRVFDGGAAVRYI